MKDFWALSPPIKQQIELRFGQPIRYSKDCENLAIHISSACREGISPTTLKRLFGFAKPITTPREYTLDVLANYLGYASWVMLKNKLTTDNSIQPDAYLLQQELVMVRTLKEIRLNHIVDLCDRSGDQEAIFPFLINLIQLAFQWKDQEFLKQIFELPKVYSHPGHDILQLYYIGQTVGTLLREYPDADEVLEAYAKSGTAHRYFIEWFVDEDYLQGYYGTLLDRYARYMEQSDANRLFYYLLKAKQATQLNQYAEVYRWYTLVQQLPKSIELHEILAARYLALVSQHEDLDVLQPSYQEWVRHYIQSVPIEKAIGFVFYLSKELFEQKQLSVLAELLNVFEHQFEQAAYQTHWSKKISKQLLIYSAFTSFKSGNKIEAQKQLDQVDPFSFDSFLFGQLSRHYDEVCTIVLAQNES
jgi:hypothetical protein